MSDLMLLYDYYMRTAETTYYLEDMRACELLARVYASLILSEYEEG